MATRKCCYVVHAVENSRNLRKQAAEHRIEYPDYKAGAYQHAFQVWKAYVVHRYRAAMFYWDAKAKCTRLYATADYSLNRDYP